MQIFRGEKLSKNKDFWEGGITSILLIPLEISLITTLILCRGIYETNPRYGLRCILFAAVILIIWISAFAYHQRKLWKNESETFYIKCNSIIVSVLGIFVGIFFSYMAWGAGYLTLMPYEQLDNGAQHIDTLFHSSIAESWLNKGYPSTLLNDEPYLSYHTFSHLLMGIIAGILQVPAFIAYNYTYPIVFLPIHVLMIMWAVSNAKNYFEGKVCVRFQDLIIVCLYIFGVTDNIGAYGIGKTSFFISESFLLANTLSFLFYGLSFWVLSNYATKSKKLLIYSVVIIPIEIFLVSWAKISVGCIFTAGVMFFFFRKGIKLKKLWLIDIEYFSVFFLCYKLFSSYVSGGYKIPLSSMFEWMPLKEQIGVGLLGMWGHYLILSLMAILFVCLDIKRNKYKWIDFIEGKTIWIECIVVMCLIAFMPSAILKFGYSDSVYFSFCIEIPSLVLLCGHDYFNIKEDAKGALRPLVYCICFGYCLWMGYHHKLTNPLTLITNEHYSNLSTMLLNIRDEVGNQPEEYTIYIDGDSTLSQVYPEGRRAIFVCPAMTGVGVINATYRYENNYYAYNGEPVTRYGMDMVSNGVLTYEDAIEVAKSRGKTHLIHLTNYGYEMVDLN
ncbi:MAG: hypothetical protein J6P79_02295 [Pseudobutyrivibrio sp.]|nr:hypothetical protein [Pseudobutyrivibrio sp.]